MQSVYRPGPEEARDWGAALKALLLLGFAGGVYGLAWAGKLKLYVHPRFTPYTLAAATVLVLMALVQLERFRAAPGGAAAPPARYALFAVPLLLGLAVPPATFGADLAARQGVNLTNRAARPGAPAPVTAPAVAAPTPVAAAAPAAAAPAAPPIEVIPPSVSAPPPATAAAPPAAAEVQPAPPRRRPAPALVNGTVVLDDKTFAPWLLEIYDNQDKYVGKPVTMSGFVFRPEGVGANEFVLVRLIVTCHVAHAAPDGFLVYWPEGDQLPDDAWFRLDGVFEMGQYQGRDTLRIRAQSLTPVAQPADPYIYG